MNLWAKTLRQLAFAAVALFFFSCEDESNILGFRNPNKKFHVGFVDIPLQSSVQTIDPLISDLRPLLVGTTTQLVDGVLVGEYVDSDFGKITTRSFLTMYPTVTTAFDATAVYDSVTVQFRLNYYAYGFSGIQERRFAIHEITGDTLTLFNGNRYYSNSPAPVYSTEPIGEARVRVNYDSLPIKRVDQDTLLATGRLNDEFGARLFNAIKPGVTTAEGQRMFKATIKGLALTPADQQGLMGLNVINNLGQLSRVFLHYHTLDDGGAVKDTLSRAFGFEYASFTKIEADRTGTELQTMQPYEAIEPMSGLRYIQSGAPILTKVDLTPFYSFADTVENIMINRAEFVIENVQAPGGQEPPESLMFRLMENNSGQFLDTADYDFLAPFRYYILSTETYYTPSTDGTSAVILEYDPDEDRYAGFMTLFAQSLFLNKKDADGINEDRLKYMALYPINPPAARSVSRAVFPKESVRLRIYYTRANTVTQ